MDVPQRGPWAGAVEESVVQDAAAAVAVVVEEDAALLRGLWEGVEDIWLDTRAHLVLENRYVAGQTCVAGDWEVEAAELLLSRVLAAVVAEAEWVHVPDDSPP